MASLLYYLGFQCFTGSEFQISYDKYSSEPQADTSKCRIYSLKTSSRCVFLVQFWICLSFKRTESFTKTIVKVCFFSPSFWIFWEILWLWCLKQVDKVKRKNRWVLLSLKNRDDPPEMNVPTKTCKLTFKPTVEAEIFWERPPAASGSVMERCDAVRGSYARAEGLDTWGTEPSALRGVMVGIRTSRCFFVLKQKRLRNFTHTHMWNKAALMRSHESDNS